MQDDEAKDLIQDYVDRQEAEDKGREEGGEEEASEEEAAVAGLIEKGGQGSGNFGHAGRQGEVGGSGGGGSNSPECIRESLSIIEETKKDGNERSFFVFKDGSASNVSLGDPTGVDTPVHSDKNVEGAGLELVHTHPFGHAEKEYTGLGTGDLNNMHQWPGISKVTALDLDGNRYTVVRQGDDREFLRNFWIRTKDITFEETLKVKDKWIEGKLSDAEFKKEMWAVPIPIIKRMVDEGLITYHEDNIVHKAKSYIEPLLKGSETSGNYGHGDGRGEDCISPVRV